MSNDTAIISLKEKIDDLNQQAWEQRVTDLPKSFELGQESVKLARSINYTKGLAEGLRSLGFSYVRYFKNEEAAPLLRESLSLFQSLNDLRGQAIVYEYLGIIERNWGNLGSSLDLLLKGNDLIQQTDPPEVELTSCYQIGVTYKHLGNHENALDYLYKTLSLAKKINFPLMEAYATNIIGSIYFDNGNYDQALDCYQQGLIIRRQSNDKWGEAGSLDNIGFTYLKLNDLDKAIEFCKQSLVICQATGDKKGEANALLHLGEIYEQAGDVKKAAGFSNESLEIRKARGDKRGETEVLLFLADLYKNRNDVEDQQIFEWLSGALKIAEEIKAQDLLSKAYYNLHEYYQQKGNFKESLVQLEAHFQIEKELHKNSIDQKIANLEISHKAEVISQRNKELTELNEKIEKANEELKIEAALERVRSASIAMHCSDELHKVIRVLTDQLSFLGFHFHTANFITNESMPDWEIWISSPGLDDTPPRIHVPYLDHFLFNERNNAITTGKEFLTGSLNKMEKDKFFHYLFEETAAKVTPTERKEWVYQQKGMGLTTVLMKNISLSVINYDGTLYTTEENEVIKRLATVFEQSYTRFLDLQKAEAQARESQIQLAMERVRARTMAMQHSDELKDAASLLFKQLEGLGIKSWSSGFNIWETEGRSAIINMCNPDGSIATPYHLPHTEEIFFIRIDEARQRGDELLVMETGGKDLEQTYNYMFSLPEVKKMLGGMEDTGFQIPKFQVSHCAFFSHGYLMFITYEPVPDMWDIFKRFAKVFEQTYTRFLDLQKAEAHSKEAQIELGLERVRARAMAMHGSDELKELVKTLFEELIRVDVNLSACLISTFDISTLDEKSWMFHPVTRDPYVIRVPSNEQPFYHEMLRAWKERNTAWNYCLEGETKVKWHDFLFADTGFALLPQSIIDEMRKPDKVFFTASYYSYGAIQVASVEPFPAQSIDIIQRFSKVFDSSYTRFLDLQKAEAQARESQVQLAMERVRARTMAMQKSDELREAVLVIYEQLQQLNFDSKACNIIIIDKESGTAQYWVSGFSQEIFPESYTVPYLDHPYQDMLLKPWKQGDKYVVYEYTGKMKQSFDELFFTQTEFRNVPEEAKKVMIGLESVTLSTAFISYGALQALGAEPLSEEKANILKRFAKVFEQTYTRFLDLQKAEAQVREAQIEAGLERVRAKTMAMHKSDEVTGIAVSLNEELLRLGFARGGSTIIIINRETGDTEQWTGFSEDKTLRSCFVPYLKHPCHDGLLNSWKKGEKFFVYTLQGDEKKALDDHYFATGYKIIPENDKKWMRELESVTFSHAFMKYGAIHWAYDHLSEEQLQILQRFSKVFEQSYTRFLDLQKAEAQARESQVEAALEKIRSRSLAMHHSRELKEVIAITFEKLNELNVLLGTVAIQLFDKKSMHSVLWVGNTIQDPQMVDLPYDKQMMLEDTLVKDSWQAMIDGVDIINKEYSVEQKNKYFNFLFSKNSLTQIPEQAREVLRQMQSHIACLFVEKNSAFLVDSWAGQFFPKENLHVLKRAAKVFEQAYIRFLDLQKAEAQAREAQIEAALEKVRSRTLAMQKSDELAETAAEVFRQLIALGIEPNRLYIGIVKEETGDMEMWATDEDGTQVGKRFMFNKNENASVLKLYDGWKTQKRSVIVDMQGKELEDYFHYLNNVMHIPFKGGLTQKRRVQSVAYFSKGFIGMASPDGQGDETIQLLERFAAVFNLTFTRFNDLKIAEAHAVQAEEDLVKLQTEKKRAEDALSELQVTQKQLIQSEKMASLGELTAGIAHEIQNPLNFVNNFSDVNKELLEEMKDEIEKGNTEEVMAIANDIISNEEKINHHGKRADAIVKGMLQHSRSSSGVKEPTDINELADEYLRLAYHGLRAKDKTFNATMKTDFDQAIGKVSVIPQEIGRVFLNLITNAFYVVAEKKKQLSNGYEPTVTVTTKKESDKVVVSVKDNGSGIPQKDLYKIFQPFFTTKPTGQGTGLGLSLSYDIVKAHSGEIKVKTKEGEGSEFVISLPVV